MWDARVQLHWAAQIPAGVGRTLIPRRDDDSNTAFRYANGALWQEQFDGKRAGIRLHDLALLVDGDAFPLRGRTLDEGFAFVESKFGAALKRPDVDLPEHAVQRGATFDPDANDLETLAGDYADAASILEKVKDGPVLCWPHHFDIATLHTLGGDKTIGIGLAPGDDAIREPYWYVNLWPYPEPWRLPPLRAGEWHTEEWTGAVLPAAQGVERAAAFVAEALARCRALLS